jgi:hypothetical protein
MGFHGQEIPRRDAPSTQARGAIDRPKKIRPEIQRQGSPTDWSLYSPTGTCEGNAWGFQTGSPDSRR